MTKRNKPIDIYGKKATKARKDCMKGIYNRILELHPTRNGMGTLKAALFKETQDYLSAPNECAWTDRCCENVVEKWKKERLECQKELASPDTIIDNLVTELEKYI